MPSIDLPYGNQEGSSNGRRHVTEGPEEAHAELWVYFGCLGLGSSSLESPNRRKDLSCVLVPITDSTKLEHPCRMIHAGFPLSLVGGWRMVMFQPSGFYCEASKVAKYRV